MEAPIQVRFEKRVKRTLSRTSETTGVDQVDYVRVAVAEFFEKYKTPGARMRAYIKHRTAAVGLEREAA